MARPKPKVVWNTPPPSLSSPLFPKGRKVSPATGNIPNKDLWPLKPPQEFFLWDATEDHKSGYISCMVQGGLFVTTCVCSLITGAWDKTQGADEQLPYISRVALNPNGLARSVKLPKGTIAIYLEQRRVPEWAGKEWRRYVRPVFIINGQAVLALSSSDLQPINMSL